MANDTFPQRYHLSRRHLIGGSLGLGLGTLLLRGAGRPPPTRAAAAQGIKHLVWVWQFSTDAEPHLIGARLLEHDLGIVLKTHDGLEWMSEYDTSPYAVSGPAQVTILANYYETAGVPFHAWAVVQGVDPVREARMAADVLATGARSLFLDVEPHTGFWVGSAADAAAFGRELRRLQPNAHLVLSLDPRPWTLARIPLREFGAFVNEIAPQQYWRTFDTPANHERFAASGFPVGAQGVTAEFLINTANTVLAPFGLPITHVGQGATSDTDEWRRFVDLAYGAGSSFVTVWRFGVTEPGIFSLLRDKPPVQPAPQVFIHIVQPGDTLSAIADAQGVGADVIIQANGLSDPDYLFVGQELQIPAGGNLPLAAPQTYAVEEGDTLYAVASRFGTSVDAIVAANGLSDPNLISIGQELLIP